VREDDETVRTRGNAEQPFEDRAIGADRDRGDIVSIHGEEAKQGACHARTVPTSLRSDVPRRDRSRSSERHTRGCRRWEAPARGTGRRVPPTASRAARIAAQRGGIDRLAPRRCGTAERSCYSSAPERSAMDSRLRARLVFHGAVVVMLGLLAGFPHAFVLTGQLAGEERAWRMAHLEGLLNGMLTMLAGAVGGALVLSASQQRWLLWSLLAAAYGNVIASVLGASAGVRGLALAGPPANVVMNLLFWVAIAGVFVGVALLVAGAAAAARAART